MVAYEQPGDRRPRQRLGIESLHGSVAPSRFRPAGNAQHRHPAGHRQLRQDDVTHLFDRRLVDTLV